MPYSPFRCCIFALVIIFLFFLFWTLGWGPRVTVRESVIVQEWQGRKFQIVILGRWPENPVALYPYCHIRTWYEYPVAWYSESLNRNADAWFIFSSGPSGQARGWQRGRDTLWKPRRWQSGGIVRGWQWGGVIIRGWQREIMLYAVRHSILSFRTWCGIQ